MKNLIPIITSTKKDINIPISPNQALVFDDDIKIEYVDLDNLNLTSEKDTSEYKEDYEAISFPIGV